MYIGLHRFTVRFSARKEAQRAFLIGLHVIIFSIACVALSLPGPVHELRWLYFNCYTLSFGSSAFRFAWVFLQVPSSQKKQRNKTIEFSWGLYFLVVLFLLLYVNFTSVCTEGTIGLN